MSVLKTGQGVRQCWIAFIHLLSHRQVGAGEYQVTEQAEGSERTSRKTFASRALSCRAGGFKVVTGIRHVVIPLRY
jgi:hypothetical protein